VARSVHTRPLSVLAPRRAAASDEPRGRRDPRRPAAIRRRLKEQGLVPDRVDLDAARAGRISFPRLTAGRPRPGHHHPVTPAELGAVLRALGPTSTYGLRLVALARGSAEGRAAARRHRNAIRVVPAPPAGRYAFAEVAVVTTRGGGQPLTRANLARGPEQLIVLPDEGALDAGAEDWSRLGRAVRQVSLDLPRASFPYRYRLLATIALAEVARQVGRPPSVARRPPLPAPPAYDTALGLLDATAGQTIYLDDLVAY
jgi:hypothetical protein